MSHLSDGDVEEATRKLEAAATRLLGMGERRLARSILLEVGTMRKTQTLTAGARKRIRFGTRSLAASPEAEE